MDALGQGLDRAIQHLRNVGQTLRGGDHHRVFHEPRPLTLLNRDR
jgi:hypothetical protein